MASKLTSYGINALSNAIHTGTKVQIKKIVLSSNNEAEIKSDWTALPDTEVTIDVESVELDNRQYFKPDNTPLPCVVVRGILTSFNGSTTVRKIGILDDSNKLLAAAIVEADTISHYQAIGLLHSKSLEVAFQLIVDDGASIQEQLSTGLAGLTKFLTVEAANAKYALKTEVYDKFTSDARYAYKTEVKDGYTKIESDNRYAYKSTSYSKGEADSRFELKGSSTSEVIKHVTIDGSNTASIITSDGSYFIIDNSSRSHTISITKSSIQHNKPHVIFIEFQYIGQSISFNITDGSYINWATSSGSIPSFKTNKKNIVGLLFRESKTIGFEVGKGFTEV